MTRVDPPRTARIEPAPATKAIVATGIGLAVIAALFVIDAFVPALFADALPTRAQDGLTLAISVLIESMPFEAAWMVWMPLEMPSRSPVNWPARSFRPSAVK